VLIIHFRTCSSDVDVYDFIYVENEIVISNSAQYLMACLSMVSIGRDIIHIGPIEQHSSQSLFLFCCDLHDRLYYMATSLLLKAERDMVQIVTQMFLETLVLIHSISN